MEPEIKDEPEHKILVHEYGDFEIRTKTKHLVVSRTCIAQTSIFYKTYFDQYPDHKYIEIDENDEDIEILRIIFSDVTNLIALAGNPYELNNSKLFRILRLINKINCNPKYTNQFVMGYIIEWGLYNIGDYFNETLYITVDNNIIEENVVVLPTPLEAKIAPIKMPYSVMLYNKLKILADIYNIVPLDKIIHLAHVILYNGRQNLIKYTKQQQVFAMDKIKQLLTISENKTFMQKLAISLLDSYIDMNIVSGFITTIVNNNGP